MNEAPRSARSQAVPLRPRSGAASALPRLLSGAVSLVGVGVALFHAGLLAERLRDLSIAEPEVLASWLGAAILGLLALYLRRRNLPIASGRSGLVFWLLVLLLHLGLTPATPAFVRAEQLLALPLELAVVVLVGALLLVVRARRVARHPVPLHRELARLCPLPSLALGSVAAQFVPRPPPAG